MNDASSVGPNEVLFQAVQSNDLSLFKQILKVGLEISTIDLNRKHFDRYEGLRILDFCCMYKGRSDFVKILLTTGVDMNTLNVWHCKAPIHLAVENGCEQILYLLLEHPKTDVNIVDSRGDSALHLAALNSEVECTKLLLQSKNIKPNKRNREGITPAYVAATSHKKCDELILAFIKCPKVNLDMTVRGKHLNEVIIKEYPHLEDHMPLTAVRNITEHKDPFIYLYLNDTEGFISCIKSSRQLNCNNGEYTYLQYACISGLTNVVQVLFDYGVDPNATLRQCDNLPIFFAAYRGFADIVQLFLARSSFFFNGKRCSMIYQTARSSVLHQVILGLGRNKNVNNALCDHYKSFKMLLQFSKYSPLSLDINRTDHLGRTCLHLAGQRNLSNYIFDLLDYGAFIGKKDFKGITSLSTISNFTLKSYLDQCVKHNNVLPNDEKYEIIFSYKFLCPPKVLQPKNNKKNQKWLESQKFDYEDIPETDILLTISEVLELRGLLLHPLLTSFLYLKWMKIRMFYYFNLLVYFGFLFVLYFYIYFNIKKNEIFPEEGILLIKGILRTLLWIYLIFFIARELFHYISSRNIYIKSLDTWIEIIVIVLTFCLLCINLEDSLIIISSILIIISWTELTFIIGQEPRMAVQVEMFKVVSKNVLKTLLLYWVILFAFIQSFYVMFSNDDKFSNIFLATFKMILMLTGEFDSSSLPFQSNPIFSRLLFVLFVFLIPVVLVNLLNGLAVSDIQAIKNDAEIIAQISRIKFINSYETIAVRNMFLRIRKSQNFIANYGCQICSVFIYLFGVINLKLFRDDREDFGISVFTNKDNAIVFGSLYSQNTRNMRFRWKNLDTEIVKKAMKIFELSSDSSSEGSMKSLSSV